jgi:iron complex outermembrane receptor protein
MGRTAVVGAVLAAALSLGLGGARAAETWPDIPAQDLASALAQLSRADGIELLFDPALAAGRRAPAVSGSLAPDQALSRLLARSDLTFRRSAGGAFVIFRRPTGPVAKVPVVDAAPPQNDQAISELLVTGRRSLNADIRRGEDDIQPYKVTSAETLARAQPDNLEDFLRSRTPADAQSIGFTQAPVLNGASTRSQIDLGGFGADQTLVLLDGHRLPSVPGIDAFFQADINGIPMMAIDRVEILTSTAGGIYGPGATGGVINIVLKRDYEGGQITAENGLTDRGDGYHWRGEASFGVASKDAATRVMLTVSHSQESGLIAQDRDYRSGVNAALHLKSMTGSAPSSPSLNFSTSPDATFLPPFSNAGTPPTFATLPPSPSLTPAQAVAGLIANAGVEDYNLPLDGSGTLQSLLTRTQTTSVVVSLRQSFGPRIEAFADYIYVDNQGRASGPLIARPSADIAGAANGNPTDSLAGVTFSTPGFAGHLSSATRQQRLATGVIVNLTDNWTGEFDATLGRALARSSVPSAGNGQDFVDATGVNLFAGTDALKAALASYQFPDPVRQTFRNEMTDFNLRLAGTVVQAPAGPLTMTVLAEARRQYDPAETITVQSSDGTTSLTSVGAQTEDVQSAYGELRAPLISDTSWVKPLRGLELQLAGRLDRYALNVPTANYYTSLTPGLAGDLVTQAQYNTATFTVGARTKPLPGLMLRASFATGYLPPTPLQILPGKFIDTEAFQWADPKRPNDGSDDAAGYLLLYHGSPKLKSELAHSASAGLVFAPAWLAGLRMSLDYTQIDMSRMIATFSDGDYNYILAHEAEYPDRVTRLPLTDADRAAGDTGGKVTAVDASPLSIGRSISQQVEADFSYSRPTKWGTFRFYNDITWRPSFKARGDPDKGYYQTVGHIDGPLRVRGNLGLDWAKGGWGAGLNVQIYSRYRVTYGATDDLSFEESFLNTYLQGTRPIPTQAYLDLYLSHSWAHRTPAGKTSGFELRAGIKDVLDTRPPQVLIPLTPTPFGGPGAVDDGLGYSAYGNPLGRRFDLTISKRF